MVSRFEQLAALYTVRGGTIDLDTSMNHEALGRCAPSGLMIDYRKGRDITNLCRHEPAKGGKVSVFPQKNRFVTVILLGEAVVS